MKNANGYGSVYKLSGKRRRPWRVRITTGWQLNEEGTYAKQLFQDLGYYETRAEAIKALADYNDDPFDVSAMKVTFEQCYMEASKEFTEGRTYNYQAAYKYLEPIKDLPIRGIKAGQMQKCIDSCTTTQQQEIKTVCHKVFAYALRMEIIDKDPSRYLKSNTVSTKIKRVVFTPEQIAELERIHEWWSDIALMLLYSGMRTKELKQLDPADIDIENGSINIRLAKNRSSIRQIPIHVHVLPLFQRYKEANGNLFGCTHDGLNKALKKFGDHTAHDCRHTFTTKMRKCKCDPLILQLLLGHTPSSITERVYTHITFEELSEALNKLNYELDSGVQNRTEQ